MRRVFLTVDIGNTKTAWGVFSLQGALLERFDTATNSYSLRKVKVLLPYGKMEGVVICSVVPPVAQRIERDMKYLAGKSVYVLGKHIDAPIRNLYRRPRQVGQDRLINAYAGVTLYRPPLIIVDFGTAITFDVVSRKGEYRGGMILPGLGLSLSSLAAHTVLLPQVRLKPPEEFIGRETESSILSGVVYGFATLVDGLITRLRKEQEGTIRVIATGGDSRFIARFCKKFTDVDRDLTLKGLSLIYREIIARRE
jgi:type III pantothenate kinase